MINFMEMPPSAIWILGFVICASLAVLGIASAQTPSFSPDPNSPAGKGEHPRLLITQTTLSAIRSRIQQYYLADFQQFITALDAAFSQTNSGDFAIAPWPYNSGMAKAHAFVCLMDTLPSITYGHTISQYCQRAGELLALDIAQPLNFNSDWNDDILLTYDWAYAALTPAQREAAVDWMARTGDLILNDPDPNHLWTFGIKQGKNLALTSSSYYSSIKPYLDGIAFYNDGYKQAEAQALTNSINTLALNGGTLDAQNWFARQHGSESEIGAYGLWNPIRHHITIDAWATATNINYYVQSTGLTDPHIANLPEYLLHRIAPYQPDPDNYWKLIKISETQPLAALIFGPIDKNLVSIVGGALQRAGNTSMAAAARWLMMNRYGERLDYSMNKFAAFIWGGREITAQSPSELSLPSSQYFEGIGLYDGRTGLENPNDTAVDIRAAPFQYGAHDGDQLSSGLTIDKYGPLLLEGHGYIRGPVRANMMRFTPTENSGADDGLVGGVNPPLNIKDFTVGSIVDLGGIVRTSLQPDLDYLQVDRTKLYQSSRLNKYTENLVYLKPSTNTQSDYIVEFNRVNKPASILARFRLTSAYEPIINGAKTTLRPDKWEYTDTAEIKVSNKAPGGKDTWSNRAHTAHGILFSKTLLPQNHKYVVDGGTQYMKNDDGTVLEDQIDFLKEGSALYTGNYVTNIVALGNNTQENFLTVLQTADANNPSQSVSMIPSTLLESQEGKMQGAFIEASQGQENAVVMFAKNEEVLDPAGTSAMSYQVTGTGPTRHIIADVAANRNYDVIDKDLTTGQSTATTYTTTDIRTPNGQDHNTPASGILYFHTTLGSTHQFTIVQSGQQPNLPPTITGPSTLSVQIGNTVTQAYTANDSEGDIVSNFNIPNLLQLFPGATFE